MKHSAKAAARLERERSRQQRRAAGRRRAGSPGPGPGQASSAGAPATDQPGHRYASPASPARPAPGADPAAAAGPAEHRKLTQLPYAIVLAGTVAGLVLMQVAKDAVRGGTLVIAGALLAASLTRLVLPEGRAGLLGSRRRLVDVALLTALGAGLLTAGLVVQVPG